MNGRNEHLTDVSRDRLSTLQRRIDLAELDYTGVEERHVLARLRGWHSALSALLTLMEDEAAAADGAAVPKTRRMLIASGIDRMASEVDGKLAFLRRCRAKEQNRLLGVSPP